MNPALKNTQTKPYALLMNGQLIGFYPTRQAALMAMQERKTIKGRMGHVKETARVVYEPRDGTVQTVYAEE